MANLNRKLALEELSRSPDGAGGYDAAWQELGVLWGAFKTATGRREPGEGHARTRATYRVTVRASPPGVGARPVAGQRFREGTRIYPIRAVYDLRSDGRYLECLVDEEFAE